MELSARVLEPAEKQASLRRFVPVFAKLTWAGNNGVKQ
jgi:hypothetical protein